MKDMNQAKKFILPALVAVYVLAAISIVASTSVAALKLAKFFILAPGILYLIWAGRMGTEKMLAWVKEHLKDLLLLAMAEAILYAYMNLFIFRLQLMTDFYIQAKIIFLSMIMGMILLVYFMKVICHGRVENVFALTALVMGMIFVLVLPIESIPDEPAHMDTAYKLSNRLLGVEDVGDGYMLMRRDDAEYPLDILYDREEIKEYWFSLDDRAAQTELIPSTRDDLGTYAFQHLAPALGLTLGRLAGLGTTGAYTIGRICSLLLYVLLTWLTIRWLPFGKMLLFVLALMPMSLQMGMSYSYDALLIPLSWLIVGLTLNLAYADSAAKETKKGSSLLKGMSRGEAGKICLLVLAEILLILQKQGAYIMVLFVPAILLFTCWKTDRRKAITGPVLVLIGLLAFLAPRVLPAAAAEKVPEAWVVEQAIPVQDRVPAGESQPEAAETEKTETVEKAEAAETETAGTNAPTADGNAVKPADEGTAAAVPEENTSEYYDQADKFSIGELLRDTRTLWLVLYNTLITFDSFYLESAIASPLGWMSIGISRVVIYAWLILMVLAALTRKEEKDKKKVPGSWNRFYLVMVGIGGICSVLAAMLLFYSPKSHMRIEGVQGRYLIPFLLPLLLMFKSDAVTVDGEKTDWRIMAAVCICCYFTVCWILP